MRAGRITCIPPSDPIAQAMCLRIEILDDDGRFVDYVIIAADAILDEDRSSFKIFAFNADEEVRKSEYLKRYPLSDGEHNRESVLLEMREDLHESFLRDRRDQKRYEGLGDRAVREWRAQR